MIDLHHFLKRNPMRICEINHQILLVMYVLISLLDGSYLHIDASGKHNEDTARITSPQLDPGQHCFKFWYSMYGLDINALNVYTKINGNIGIPILALKNNTGSKAWGQAHIYIQSTHYYQVCVFHIMYILE